MAKRPRKKKSRQQKWQEARRKQGVCVQCGHEPLLTKNLGARCAKRQRERMRKKTSAQIRYKNSQSYQRPEA